MTARDELIEALLMAADYARTVRDEGSPSLVFDAGRPILNKAIDAVLAVDPMISACVTRDALATAALEAAARLAMEK